MLPQAPLQPLTLSWLAAAGIQVAILRLDLIDPLISGNKWFKLKHYLAAAETAGAQGLISLGGAHSNHLHALAAAGKRFGFQTVGLLRGHPVETLTVMDVQAFGMQLHWLGYAGYRARHEPEFWTPWRERYPQLYSVPEGAGGLDGASGCADIVSQAHDQLGTLGWDDFDGWWLACGTGTTLAGLVLAEKGRRTVHGAMAVPTGHGVEVNVTEILGSGAGGYRLFDASRGAFAKVDPELLAFIAASEDESGVPLEPLYTGKALLALFEAVRTGQIRQGTRLIFVHTGGLQGKRGLSA